MATTKNDDDDDKPRSFGEAVEQIYRAVASLEVSLGKIAKNQAEFKLELRTVAPRIDAVGARVDTLAAEIGQLAERVHRTNNIVQILIDEGNQLHQAQATLNRALDVVQTQFKERTYQLEDAHGTVEKMLEVVEGRVRQLRNDFIDANAATGQHTIPVDRSSEDAESTKP